MHYCTTSKTKCHWNHPLLNISFSALLVDVLIIALQSRNFLSDPKIPDDVTCKWQLLSLAPSTATLCRSVNGKHRPHRSWMLSLWRHSSALAPSIQHCTYYAIRCHTRDISYRWYSFRTCFILSVRELISSVTSTRILCNFRSVIRIMFVKPGIEHVFNQLPA